MTPVTVQIQTKLKDALNVAINMRVEERYEDALNYMESVRGFFEEDELYMGRFGCGLGVTRLRMGHLREAIEEYEKAYGLLIKHDEAEAAVVLGNIADAYVELNQIPDAHSYLDRAEAILKNHSEIWYAERRETRARAYLKSGHIDDARDAISEAVSILEHGFEERALNEAKATHRLCFESLGEERWA